MPIELTQEEADSLMQMEKHYEGNTAFSYPQLGGKESIPLKSTDGREEFLLDLYCGRIDLGKITYQSRARKIIILARVDLAGHEHVNPDGEVIPTPHIHFYKEGFGDRWAESLPIPSIPNASDPFDVLDSFLELCNVTKPPSIERGLFS